MEPPGRLPFFPTRGAKFLRMHIIHKEKRVGNTREGTASGLNLEKRREEKRREEKRREEKRREEKRREEKRREETTSQAKREVPA